MLEIFYSLNMELVRWRVCKVAISETKHMTLHLKDICNVIDHDHDRNTSRICKALKCSIYCIFC